MRERDLSRKRWEDPGTGVVISPSFVLLELAVEMRGRDNWGAYRRGVNGGECCGLPLLSSLGTASV